MAMGWLGHRHGDARRQFGWWASNGEETWRTVVDDDRVDSRSRVRERERANERDWVFSEMAGAREKGRARLTGGVGRSVGEGWSWRAGGRAEGGPRGPGGGRGSAGARERGGEDLGQIRPSQRGISLFFFFFYFFPISISLIPFPLNKYSYNSLGDQNEILYVKCYKKSWCMHMMSKMLHEMGSLGDNRGFRVSNLRNQNWDVTDLPHLKESRPRDSDWVREKR
jgi:hypothetical protein